MTKHKEEKIRAVLTNHKFDDYTQHSILNEIDTLEEFVARAESFCHDPECKNTLACPETHAACEKRLDMITSCVWEARTAGANFVQEIISHDCPRALIARLQKRYHMIQGLQAVMYRHRGTVHKRMDARARSRETLALSGVLDLEARLSHACMICSEILSSLGKFLYWYR